MTLINSFPWHMVDSTGLSVHMKIEVTTDADKASTLRKVADLITLPHIHAYASTIDDLQVTPDDIKALKDVYNLIKTITLAE